MQDGITNNKTILIVDDVKAIRERLRQLLNGMGFSRIDCAANAKTAYQHLEAKPYDIIFLDIELPDSNGKEMLDCISDEYAHSKVVMCSGNNSLENIRQTWEMGAKGFISKPLNEKKVATIVKRLERF
ncbi:MAG: two-component system chemotaxis response regulator CheY [Phenylobacterium sp.]|jgi:two-component system chemotaxis response regulator CheY